MKRLIIAISLVLAIFCLACGEANQQTQATADSASAEQELIQLHKDINNAFLKRDAAFLDQAFADDCLGTDEEGALHPGKADLLSDTTMYSSIVVDDIKASVFGDAGVVWMRTTEEGQSEGKYFSGQYQRTCTWIRRSGQWQMVAGHTSKVANE